MIKHPILGHTFFWANNDGSISFFDSGTSAKDAKLALRAIKKVGFNINDLKQLIISHSHFDHIGGIPTIKKTQPEIQIVAHKIETHFLENPYRLDSRHLRGFTKWVYLPFFRYFETRPIKVNHKVTSKTNDKFFSFIHLPGHTLGSMGLYLKDSGVIFTGDALYTGKNGHIDYSPSNFSLNPELERKSIQKLREYEFEILVSSHGLPINKARKRLEVFLEER
ncbi:MAG: MBL fold metallo-hydrolase [Candidatus Hodarchaeota archaeon]